MRSVSGKGRRLFAAPIRWLVVPASAIAVVTVLWSGAAGSSAASSPIIAAWTQLGPSSSQLARVVISSGGCPAVTVVTSKGSSNLTMAVRATPSLPSFPDTVCEVAIPSSATKASVPGDALPLRGSKIRHVAFIGDTGCAIEGSKAQDCNDPTAWPFATSASQIAAAHPDLIVHLGDLLYRKGPCPTSNPNCGPVGFNLATLEADFFTPAAPLLAAAPMIMIRGNHEACGKKTDSVSWSRYFAFGPVPSSCQTFTPPYRVKLTSGHQLVVMDTSAAPPPKPPGVTTSALTAQYRKDFKAAIKLASKRTTWLISHVPVWDEKKAGSGPDGSNILQKALHGLNKSFRSEIRIVISGHVHQFQYLSWSGKRPAQLILGDGGTQMSKPLKGSFAGLTLDGMRIAEGSGQETYGYALAPFVHKSSGKSIVIKQPSGSKLANCSLTKFSLHCK